MGYLEEADVARPRWQGGKLHKLTKSLKSLTFRVFTFRDYGSLLNARPAVQPESMVIVHF